MRKLFLLLAFTLFMIGVSAQQDLLKYRISLKDKAATEYSLKRPEKFLSEKAIEPVSYTHLTLPTNSRV